MQGLALAANGTLSQPPPLFGPLAQACDPSEGSANPAEGHVAAAEGNAAPPAVSLSAPGEPPQPRVGPSARWQTH